MEKKIKALRQKKADIYKEMTELLNLDTMTEEQNLRYGALEKDMTQVAKDLQRAEDLRAMEHDLESSVSPDVRRVEVGQDRAGLKPFRCLGEQLQAVYEAGNPNRTAPVDPRLLTLNEQYRAAYAGPSGMNEGVDSEGAFAIQTDFAGLMFDTAVRDSEILSRCDNYPVGPGSNGAKWVDIDETDISSTVFGGVQVYWTAEADTVTSSKPKLKKREMLLLKLMGLGYATEEMMQDVNFIDALYTRAFTTAIRRKLTGNVISGTGAGQPLGLLNSPALVTIDKETGQAADTVVYENFVHMWGRRWTVGNPQNLCFVVHPDIDEQMLLMSFPVGTGGVPVFLPPGGASEKPYSTLFGRPILPDDNCSALGDKGDIFLADLSEYMLIAKGGPETAWSMHVRFEYGEQAFRITYRANGAPKRPAALTIKNSSKTRSPYITLAARA